MEFDARGKIFEIKSGRPLIMGVLNVTPDSFYDGGRHVSVAAALERARRMVDEGADIVDVGGESTRPGAARVPEEEEIARVVPIVEKISATISAAVSVDTFKPRVAEAALAAGAVIINDVTACGVGGGRMADVAAASGAGLVLMHMRGSPATMQTGGIEYADVVSEVKEYLAARAAFAEARGVSRNRIVVDPGIGFGKTAEHNMKLIRGLRKLTDSGFPVLVGASRKSFLRSLPGMEDPEDRLYGTLAAHAAAVINGASAIRVHDVRPHKDFFRAFESIKTA